MMAALWMKKEVARVLRVFGPKCRVCAKKRQPQRKKKMDVRDLSQPSGWEIGWLDAPRARKIVFPRRVLITGVGKCRE